MSEWLNVFSSGGIFAIVSFIVDHHRSREPLYFRKVKNYTNALIGGLFVGLISEFGFHSFTGFLVVSAVVLCVITFKRFGWRKALVSQQNTDKSDSACETALSSTGPT
jgi:hypothetical protein